MGTTSGKLIEQIRKRNYVNYPLENKKLKDETDYIRNNYFKHLALVLTQRGETSENQRYLFSRMLTGVAAEAEIEEYLRQAMEIEIEEYEGFMEQMKEMALRYRFVLDAVLIACCDECSDGQKELLALFMESLKVGLDEAAFICGIARSILEQDAKGYWQGLQASKEVSFRNFAAEYAVDFAGEYLCKITDNSLFLYFPEKTELTKQKLIDIGVPLGMIGGYKEVEIGNAIFHLREEDLEIKEVGKAVFTDCEFEGDLNENNYDDGSQYAVRVKNADEVIFEDCRFVNFKNRAVYVDCGEEASILFKECSFHKCYLYENGWFFLKDWENRGGVIWAEKPCGLTIQESVFDACGVIVIGNIESSAIILNQPATVRKCRFQQCWGYHSTVKPDAAQIDRDTSRRTLFADGSVNEGCVIVDSASFGDEKTCKKAGDFWDDDYEHEELEL